MIPLIAQSLLSLLQARTLPRPVLGDSSLPDAIPIVAQLLGVDDVPTKINDPKPAITKINYGGMFEGAFQPPRVIWVIRLTSPHLP